MRLIDLKGQRFGKLTVLERACPERKGKVYWVCRCDCGNYTVVAGDNLKSGNTKGCGCMQVEGARKVNKKHGRTGTKLYKAWDSMRQRCYNPQKDHYEDYGGRGISVCDEWANDFSSFCDWAMSHGYNEKLTLDRIDVDGNYCPENCRWSTMKEQQNNRRSNHLLTYKNETHTMMEWSEILGVSYSALKKRIYKGMSTEEAFESLKGKG